MLDMMAHVCNLSYAEGGLWFEASWGKKLARPPSQSVSRYGGTCL
jgi:hypothetical protein